MNFVVQLALILAFAVQSFGELLHCREIMQEVCSKTDNYVSSISPDPLPTKVRIIRLHFWRGSVPS
jgi:hypothetical protein